MPSKSPSEYTQQEVAVWLNSIGLGSKIDGFKENAIDGAMLVTLTPDDLTGDLGFSSLQVRKFQQSLEFANSLAEGGGGGGDPEKLQALEEENQRLKQQITDLKMKNKELYEKLSSSTQSAPVPAPPPPQAYSHPPPQTHRAPAPAPRPAGAPVIRGAAGGATKGAVMGAIGGAIAGDAGQGAKMGAAMGAAGGGMGGLAQRRRQRMRR
mmetsp:Transcript_25074/g.44466  ORF Transcript_25074/g.44466 Transcript_25074/m.44466 type:complete len:209 (+) Transcript_25074:63-689(+)